ncbi:hypothetical protein ACX0HA_04695 [Flavobacterium hauense]
MKNIFGALLLLCTTIAAAQTDKHGNPVFNSVTISNETLKNGLEISANYYTLKNNIETNGSSAFVAENPTKEQVINAAQKYPSDFFILTKNGTATSLMMFSTDPSKQIILIDPDTGDIKEFPIEIKGDITENRANEIIKEKYDPSATLKNGKLTFDGKTYTVISSKDIKKDINKIIEIEKLSEKKTAENGVKLLSSAEIKEIMLTETAPGGEFDFFTAIKGKEMNGVQIKPGVFDTEIGVALYRWGHAAFELGVNTPADALSIFAEFRGRPVNKREEEYIKMGFNKELEK